VTRPIAATAYWHEYKLEQGQSGRQDAMWVRMPRVMLAKVAEALALRKGFPYDPERRQGIGADLYTADEMAQANRGTAPATTAKPALGERLAARRQATQAEQQPIEIEGESRELGAAEATTVEPEQASAFDDAKPDAASFLDALRNHAAEGEATEAGPDDIKRLRESAFAGIPSSTINAGIAAAFGPGAKAHPTTAQLTAIEVAADSLGPETFQAAWQQLAREGAAS
jgi:hypothetical protein